MPTNPPFPAVTIKSNFQTGDKPTQVQFAQFIDGVAAIDANSPLNNFTATNAPTINDDANDGYTVGSRWVDTATDIAYTCVDSTVGAAIWQAGGGGSALPNQSGNSGRFLTTDGTNPSWGDVSTIPAQFNLSGDITPATLTANTDNWNPAGLTSAAVIRVATDASRNLTGLLGGADGRTLRLLNVGAQPLVLVHDATSTAANRFLCPGNTNFTLAANSGVELVYDSTSSRWRVLEVVTIPAAASETVQGIVELATNAEASSGTDNTRAITPVSLFGGLNATGAAPIFASRAWVNFNGTGTVAVRGSGNVSSITDNGVGDYTVNFTTPMPDINYSIVGFASDGATPGCIVIVSRATTNFRFTTRQSNNPVVGDFGEVHVAVFR